MQDWETGKFVMTKVVRRTAFILGKSSHLREQHVAQMANGDVRVISVRNPELYDRTVTSQRLCSSYETAVGLVRVVEASYITQELPEVNA
ncbi:hypothetical protein ACFYO2_26485 [Streptomyces sp. NPDC006602]|uniref:hypothetical protein n=1 Tax=Streptomyces sp. NPDC006602 TaxID=3364751 RepID=UPI0036A1DBA5